MCATKIGCRNTCTYTYASSMRGPVCVRADFAVNNNTYAGEHVLCSSSCLLARNTYFTGFESCRSRDHLNLTQMTHGDPVHSTGDRNLVALYAADVELRSCVSQAISLAMACTESFRGLGSLLHILDRCRPPSSGSQHSRSKRCSVDEDDATLLRRHSVDCSTTCSRGPACDSPCSNSSDSSSTAQDSPLKVFQAPDPTCTAPSLFMSSYQDLNCSRVAAFADVAAAPSLLASCKNGAFSPSPASQCHNTRHMSPDSVLSQEQNDVFSAHVRSSCVALACLRPCSGWSCLPCTQCSYNIAA